MKARASLPGNPGHHAVQIYSDPETFSEVTVDFLADGLVAAQPTVVIDTSSHAVLIIQELRARRFDVPTLLTSGSLLVLDAQEMLNVVSLDGRPDLSRFKEAATLAFGHVTRVGGDPVVRVYSGLADLLCGSGKSEAALSIEALWNELSTTHQFSLLCGYASPVFTTQRSRRKACACHTHVYQGPSV